MGVPFSAAMQCNLLEDLGPSLPIAGDETELAYRPHQIISLLVR